MKCVKESKKTTPAQKTRNATKDGSMGDRFYFYYFIFICCCWRMVMLVRVV